MNMFAWMWYFFSFVIAIRFLYLAFTDKTDMELLTLGMLALILGMLNEIQEKRK